MHLSCNDESPLYGARTAGSLATQTLRAIYSNVSALIDHGVNRLCVKCPSKLQRKRSFIAVNEQKLCCPKLT